ncbi:MAG TPA: MiaB/RimO family radical SAM methylthiotransferase, partial [Planctomycetota bacterium]|nr:MiaB/RimO family radical SAM methylthiotransferase [Planctomycetota bacterium]
LPLAEPVPALAFDTASSPAIQPGTNERTFAVLNFGCKANAWDGQALRERLHAAGLAETDPDNPVSAPPDVLVLNSCTVTDTADREALAVLRKMRRRFPAAQIVATGCMADISPAEMLAAAHSSTARPSLLLPTADKLDILARLGLQLPAGTASPVPASAPIDGSIARFEHRSRAFVKIQDGCDLCCAFCIIPQARGMPRSRTPEAIAAEVLALDQAGYREIVLTGIHLGAYGKDFAPDAYFPGSNSAKRGPNLVAELLERLLALPIRARFRISSLEVTELSDHLLDLMAGHPDRLCPHLHLPLQAGDDAILKAMRRWYTTAEFTSAVDRYRRKIPTGALSTDVIVGFPAETDTSFARTMDYIRQIGFSRLHVFPYSPRKKTVASRLPGQRPWRERKQRAAYLRQIGIELSQAYHQSFVGREATVVLEPSPPVRSGTVTHHPSTTTFAGYTEQYIPVRVTAPTAWLRRLARVKLGAALPETAADHVAPALAAEPLELLY